MTRHDVERMESELEVLRHAVRIDWRELHELEKLIDAKIALTLMKQKVAEIEAAHPSENCPARHGGNSCIC